MPETVDWGLDADDAEEDRGPTFTAAYPGRCINCGEPFDEGDSVFYVEGELWGEACCG